MNIAVEPHYCESLALADTIGDNLKALGKDLKCLNTRDLSALDEFHIRGRKATLEVADAMSLTALSRVLDIGSGLGGLARTLAETYDCHVTGIDLTTAFCDAANTLSNWVGLQEKTNFILGNATDLPFSDNQFDAAMTLHVGMNIENKDEMYAQAHRVLRPGGKFVMYDVLQDEGGKLHFPVPWAREPMISHLATIEEMRSLLTGAGFQIIEVVNNSDECRSWYKARSNQITKSGSVGVSQQIFLGDDFPKMARNMIRNLSENRVQVTKIVCQK